VTWIYGKGAIFSSDGVGEDFPVELILICFCSNMGVEPKIGEVSPKMDDL